MVILTKIFLYVSFSGLLWGYNDELPCLPLDKPAECPSDSGDSGDDPFGGGFGDDVWGDDEEEDDGEQQSSFDTALDASAETTQGNFFQLFFTDFTDRAKSALKSLDHFGLVFSINLIILFWLFRLF